MIFIDAAQGKQTPYTPIWLMRQAGRYLSEYQKVRKKAGSFLDLCKNAELSAQVTLQPIDILDCDAAILFSDILVIPLEMGLELQFLKNEGPKFLRTIEKERDVDSLLDSAHKRLDYVYETISLIKKNLSKEKALIGFCGAPWTLATYMIEGSGSKTYAKSKKMIYQNPALAHNLLAKITENLKYYLSAQIKAGADCVMIFDSWAGALEENAYFEFGFFYINEIAKFIKQNHPNTPIIVFPKGVGGFLNAFQHIEKNFDVFGIDWNINLAWAKSILGQKFVLQGNLEPCRIYNEDSMLNAAQNILDIMGKNGGHIFNLGHGMLPDLPRQNAIKLIQFVREKSKR